MNSKLILVTSFLILFYTACTIGDAPPQKSICSNYVAFNSSKWKENKEARFCMLDDIINSKVLLNKSKEEVKSILGAPLTESDFFGSEALQYKTTVKSNKYLSWCLFIKLEKDTVVKLSKSLD